MTPLERYRPLVEFYAGRHEVPLRLALAQVEQESGFSPKARSAVGASGLLQLMPRTAGETWARLYPSTPWHPDLVWLEGVNLDLGFYYLHRLFYLWPEIPSTVERWKFALGAYNGGQAYIIRAAQLGREQGGQPMDYRDWRDAGSPPGAWQVWGTTASHLPRVRVAGRKPDDHQIQHYVERIELLARSQGGDPWMVGEDPGRGT